MTGRMPSRLVTITILVAAPIALGAPGFAIAAETATAPLGGEISVGRLTTAVFGLFVVATLMESALATLFNWRLWREFFNGRAVKTLVMIGFGWAVVRSFGYDIFHDVVVEAGGRGDEGGLSEFLSALVLAGGSTAVYELFRALGLRAPVEPAEPVAKPAPDKAWVSVRVIDRSAIGDVAVRFDEVDAPSAEALAAPALAGIVRRRRFKERLKGVFFGDTLRFPPSGGRVARTGKVYRIVVSGRRRGAEGGEEFFEREIFVGRFAGGGIVDFVAEV